MKLVLRQWRTFLFAWDLPLAVGTAALVATLVSYEQLCENLPLVIRIETMVAGVFIGLVLTSYSIVLVLLPDELLAILDEDERGVEYYFLPFRVTLIMAIVVVFSGVVALLVTDFGSEWWVRGVTFVMLWFFLWTLFTMVGLISLLFSYVKLKMLHSGLEEPRGR